MYKISYAFARLRTTNSQNTFFGRSLTAKGRNSFSVNDLKLYKLIRYLLFAAVGVIPDKYL